MVELQEQLRKIQETAFALKESGLDREILIAYLKDKSGMSKRNLVLILEAQNEFFQKLAPPSKEEGD
jgi:hypothetical protein